MPGNGKKKTPGMPPARRRKVAKSGGNSSRQGSAIDPTEVFKKLGTVPTEAAYKAKSYVFRQGAKCDAVFYILDGQIQMTVVSKEGKERVVAILGPGAFLGEGCLAGHPLYLASARALMASNVIRLDAESLRQAIHDYPEVSRMFMAFLLERNSQIESDLVDQLFNSSEKRLARLLLMLAQVGKEATFHTIVAPVSQEVLAARVGTTRSRINHFLNKFRKLGLIEYNGTLKVHSSLMNVIVRE